MVAVLCAFADAAPAGQVANVDYVHKYITQKWGITVPIRAANIYQVVNVKYVLCAIDRGNEILNGTPPTTTYCNHALATNQVIDTFAVNDAVNRLMKQDLYPGTGGEGESFKVYVTQTTSGNGANAGVDRTDMTIGISATGNFTIDWGDNGAVSTVNNTVAKCDNVTQYCNGTRQDYWHTYKNAGNYVITINGRATGYCSPYVNGTFTYSPICFNVNVVSGATATLVKTGISGDIGSIFPILGDADNQKPAFTLTFGGVPSIPSNLFAGLHGSPGKFMFDRAFYNTTATTIPKNLFNGISGPLQNKTFYQTFFTGAALTGPSATSGGQFLYQNWPTATTTEVGQCYTGATGLSDYASIPAAWK